MSIICKRRAAPPDFEEAFNKVAIFGDPDYCIQRIETLRRMGIWSTDG